ncbi:GrpB family protein [Kribbella sp. NPDC026611]|uniref:GrpB family protein n=1 Tax=Kribbella sp. NPDC026611 TaxID=3154911 RepID=UPI0033F5441B
MTVLAEYQECWPEEFLAMADRLRPVLGDTVTEIEHIGSTAVPGLLAKPVIDIAARAVSLDEVAGRDLSGLGFEYQPDGPPGRRTYTRVVDGVLTHNLHVFPSEVWDGLNQRMLRDYLRETPEAVAEYAALKRGLAADGVSGFDYTKAKTEVVQRLTDAARARLGLPSVPVWES